jgi:hypothetical protein
MSKTDLLIIEFLREGSEIKKQLVSSATVAGLPGQTAGEFAALTVIGIVNEVRELRPGDQLTIRMPIEGVDVPDDEAI